MSRLVLVTGGNGFLGRALVRRLIARGDRVRILARSAITHDQAECFRGNVADPAAVEPAIEGCDVVFHVAAKTGIGGKFEDYLLTNVAGTDVVIAACQNVGVPRLVYTSTPSVVFGARGHEGADESAPLVTSTLSPYAWTKARAEEKVLAAHGSALATGGTLATCALRPHLVWGPEDTQLTARILSRARAGKLRLIGGGAAKVDAVYIDNAVDAHLLAAENLPGKAAGKAYFVTNEDPRSIAEILNLMLAAARLPPVKRSIPLWLAYSVGWVLEQLYRGRETEPMMTRFLALQLGTPHWFDASAARRDLGYVPKVSVEEGMKRLAEWLTAEGART